MKRFIQSKNRNQVTLLPERLDDYISEDNPVRVIDLCVDEQDLMELGFDGAEPASTGRPSYTLRHEMSDYVASFCLVNI